MPDAFVPADHGARRAIAEQLDENMIVEAGAGTGKTSSLVDRVVALVSKGRATMDRIAAITFGEAAAAELRERIREALERAASSSEKDGEERENCERAVSDLDQASVQTLHSFGGSILRERPIEAGLPPGFEVMDEIRADLSFDEQWEAWVEAALDDPDLATALRTALTLGLTLGHLRQVAAAFHRSYDLVREAEFNPPPMPEGHAAAQVVEASGELERLCSFAQYGEDDPLVMHVREVRGLARRLQAAADDTLEVYRIMAQGPSIKPGNKGNQKNWNEDTETGDNACRRLKQLLPELDNIVQDELVQVRTASLVPLLRAIREFVLGYAEERRRQGVAEFHDLLVWARDLLRDNLDVRDHFRDRYTHLLIDEMQDTDPLQAEIAMFLAEKVSPGVETGARPRRWTEVNPEEGKLFVVGDPKQSIYRFRRADVTIVGRLREVTEKEPVLLTQNFRSQRPVIEWVNHLFGQWMQPGPGQPEYAPLVHRWEPEADHPSSPAVRYIGGALDGARAEEVRREEARTVAALASRAREEEWPVLDEDETACSGREQFRPAACRDICILMPSRTVLPSLELALGNAGVPYRLESASLVFSTQEVRDLLNCLRAIDNPADQVSLVAALRSPAFACSDVDLASFTEAGGRLDYLDPGRLSDGPVLEAMSTLRGFHGRRIWKQPASVIEEFVRERRLMELALSHPRPRERWRRYRFLVERARAFAAAGGNSLKGFLDWAERQEEEGARMAETVVPEADEDAVRVMTIHGAKGLEFPVVALVGLGTSRNPQAENVIFDRDGGAVEVRTGIRGAYFETPGYGYQADAERQREAEEDVRLMYVGVTRARDHLVTSLYRTSRDNRSAAAHIASLLDGAEHLWWEVSSEGAGVAPGPAEGGGSERTPEDDTPEARQHWLEERTRIFKLQSRPDSVAATTLAQEMKAEQLQHDEPWRRGRGGTSLGRAIHAVLQTIDLESGKGLEATARAQATAEGIPSRAAEVANLVNKALRSSVVKRALSARRWWREVPVAAPVEGGVLEGFIDLLFEEDDGLVVVDYKTDALESEDAITRAMQRYRIQGGAYATALERAAGRPVKEVVFLFLQPEKEVRVQDLHDAMTDAQAVAIGALS